MRTVVKSKTSLKVCIFGLNGLSDLAKREAEASLAPPLCFVTKLETE